MHLTLAATVVQMKRTFTGLASVLTAAESVWNEVSDGLRQVAADLDLARRHIPELADIDLADAIGPAGLRELRDLLNTDPLALWQLGRVDTGRLDRLKRQASAVAARAAELASARVEAGQRIAAASATVRAARQAWQRCDSGA